MLHSYDFDDELRMSQDDSSNSDIESILMNNIPGSLRVFQAHQENDRGYGIDWWVEHSSGRFMGIDCKVRKVDWSKKVPPRDDVALETWSVIEKRIPGWTRVNHKKTEYVLWLWKDTGRWMLVPFPMLCGVFSRNWQGWRRRYQTNVQQTVRDNDVAYHSECVFVPRKDLWSGIAELYAGRPV